MSGDDMASMEPQREEARTQFLTVAEVAEKLRVSRMTVYRLVHAGELPAMRVGRSYRVVKSAVDAMVEESLNFENFNDGSQAANS